MNFHWPFFRKPAHTEVRYVVAHKAENEAARAKAIQRRLELAVACAQLDDSKRDAFIAAAKNGGRG